MNIRFELTGLTPLLMHQDAVEEADRLSAWRKDPANKNASVPGDDRSPAWAWQTYCYHDGENIVIPSANLMVALRKAGAQMILKKQKTFKELSQSGMFVQQEFLDFECGSPLRKVATSDIAELATLPFAQQADGARKLGFRLWAKRAKVGTGKHVRVRPRFDAWRVSGTIEVVAPELTREIVAKLLELSGRIGLGDWRPGCSTPGPFGMFAAKVF